MLCLLCLLSVSCTVSSWEKEIAEDGERVKERKDASTVSSLNLEAVYILLIAR